MASVEWKLLKANFVGSGKITRRIKSVELYYSSNRSKKFSSDFVTKRNQAKKKSLNTFKKYKTNKSINFTSPEQKTIWNYWNSLGFPFTIHRPVQSKVTISGLRRIEAALKKHSQKQITTSIDRCYNLFNQSWFKYKVYFSKTKIDLPSFFQFSKPVLKHIRKRNPSMPASWFKTCLNDDGRLERKFTVVEKDLDPKITQMLVDIWLNYTGRNSSQDIHPRKLNTFKRVAKILLHLCKVNQLDALMAVDLINQMMNNWKTYKPKHPGYLITEIFWGNEFPNELVRSNMSGRFQRVSDWSIPKNMFE